MLFDSGVIPSVISLKYFRNYLLPKTKLLAKMTPLLTRKFAKYSIKHLDLSIIGILAPADLDFDLLDD